VLSAATLALTGDADGAEAIARRLLERPDAVSPASEVLAAIGR
jgi:hypothetical protein